VPHMPDIQPSAAPKPAGTKKPRAEWHRGFSKI
jgi:hypothetical protein